MKRRADWPEQLAAYIDMHRHVPFAWGDHDCARFAAGAVRVLTGVEVAPQWRDKCGAVSLLRRTRGLAAAVDTLLPRLLRPALAQRGDIALVRNGHRRWLAVVDSPGCWAPASDGLICVDRALAVQAWGVGHA